MISSGTPCDPPFVAPDPLTQLRQFWPDVAEPFSEVIPSGCLLVRTEDEWRAGETRRRLVDLRRADDAPDLDALVEEAAEDAFREGWTPLHEEGEAPRFELEDVILTVDRARCPLLLGETEVLRVQFDQPWPADFAAPVETSEMFQNLVRSMLRLGEDPQRLLKIVVFDPLSSARSDVLHELVEMRAPEDLRPRFDELSFSPPAAPGGPWVSKETTGEYVVTARVTKTDGWAKVEMEKRRMVS